MPRPLAEGTIRFTPDTRSLKEVEKSVGKTVKKIEGIASRGGLVSKSYTQPLGKITGAVGEFEKSLEASNARVIAFGASAGIIYNVGRALDFTVRSAIMLEKRLAEINVILNESNVGLQRFGSELFEIGKKTGQSFDDVSNAALEFARQGLAVEETLKRTSDAMILTRLSGLDVLSSVESITATLNSFNQTVIDSTTLVNKLANVDAAFAVSSGDLANAIRRVGSSAQDAGLNIDELIAMVTTAQQVTARGGNVIGNSLKTIFTRLQRPQVLADLQAFGVAVKDAQGNMLPTMVVLQNFAKAYENMAPSTRAMTAEMVGGVFQVNVLKAAMGDLGKQFSIYDRALLTSVTSTNQAIDRNAQLNKTLSTLINESMANLQKVGAGFADVTISPSIKNVLTTINEALDSLSDRADSDELGVKFGKGILEGIGNMLKGPGLLLLGGLLAKLTQNFFKFSTDAVKTFAGMNEGSRRQADLQMMIQNLLLKNPDLIKSAMHSSEGLRTVEHEILKIVQTRNEALEQSVILSTRMATNLGKADMAFASSKVLGPGIAATGFVPNFNKNEVAEKVGALGGGYEAGQIKQMNMPGVGNVTYNSAETVKRFDGMRQPAIMPPEGSDAGKSYKDQFAKSHGFNPYSSKGFVPNFEMERVERSAGAYKAGKVRERADMFDSFWANVDVLRMDKGIKEYQGEARKIAQNILGFPKAVPVNERQAPMKAFFNKYKVDEAAQGRIKPEVDKENYNFMHLQNQIQGAIGEHEAHKMVKGSKRVDKNAFFDLVSEGGSPMEVRTRMNVQLGDILKKGINQYLSSAKIEKMGSPWLKNRKKDTIALGKNIGKSTVIVPKGSKISGKSQAAQGFIPSLAYGGLRDENLGNMYIGERARKVESNLSQKAAEKRVGGKTLIRGPEGETLVVGSDLMGRTGSITVGGLTSRKIKKANPQYKTMLDQVPNLFDGLAYQIVGGAVGAKFDPEGATGPVAGIKFEQEFAAKHGLKNPGARKGSDFVNIAEGLAKELGTNRHLQLKLSMFERSKRDVKKVVDVSSSFSKYIVDILTHNIKTQGLSKLVGGPRFKMAMSVLQKNPAVKKQWSGYFGKMGMADQGFVPSFAKATKRYGRKGNWMNNVSESQPKSKAKPPTGKEINKRQRKLSIFDGLIPNFVSAKGRSTPLYDLDGTLIREGFFNWKDPNALASVSYNDLTELGKRLVASKEAVDIATARDAGHAKLIKPTLRKLGLNINKVMPLGSMFKGETEIGKRGKPINMRGPGRKRMIADRLDRSLVDNEMKNIEALGSRGILYSGLSGGSVPNFALRNISSAQKLLGAGTRVKFNVGNAGRLGGLTGVISNSGDMGPPSPGLAADMMKRGEVFVRLDNGKIVLAKRQNLSPISQLGGVLGKAKGLVPNFALKNISDKAGLKKALGEAKDREMSAGFSAGQIRVGRDKRLKGSGGVGVYNSTEGSLSNAINMHLSSGKSLSDIQKQGASLGHVPNFASGDTMDITMMMGSLGMVAMSLQGIGDSFKSLKPDLTGFDKAVTAATESLKDQKEKAKKDIQEDLGTKREKEQEAQGFSERAAEKDEKASRKTSEASTQEGRLAEEKKKIVKETKTERTGLSKSLTGKTYSRLTKAEKQVVDGLMKDDKARRNAAAARLKSIRKEIAALKKSAKAAGESSQADKDRAKALRAEAKAALKSAQTKARISRTDIAASRTTIAQNTAAKKEAGAWGGKKGRAMSFMNKGGAMQLAMSAPMIGGMAGQFAEDDTTKAGITGATNAAAMGATGAQMGMALGPWGAAAGAIAGLAMGWISASKEMKKAEIGKSIKEAAKESELLGSKLNRVTAAGQKYMMNLDKMEKMLDNAGSTTTQDLANVRKEIAVALSEIPDEFRGKFQGALGDAEKIKEVFGEITTQLQLQKSSFDSAKGVYELQQKYAIDDGIFQGKDAAPAALAAKGQIAAAVNRGNLVDDLEKGQLGSIGDLFKNQGKKLERYFGKDFIQAIMGQAAGDIVVYEALMADFFQEIKEGAKEAKIAEAILTKRRKVMAAQAKVMSGLNAQITSFAATVGSITTMVKEDIRSLYELQGLQMQADIKYAQARLAGQQSLADPFMSKKAKAEEKLRKGPQGGDLSKAGLEIRAKYLRQERTLFEKAAVANADIVMKQFNNAAKKTQSGLQQATTQRISTKNFTMRQKQLKLQQALVPLAIKSLKVLATGNLNLQAQSGIMTEVKAAAIKATYSTEEAQAISESMLAQLKAGNSKVGNDLAKILRQQNTEINVLEIQNKYALESLKLQRKLSVSGGAQDFLSEGATMFSSQMDKLASILNSQISAAVSGGMVQSGRAQFQLMNSLINTFNMDDLAKGMKNIGPLVLGAMSSRKADLDYQLSFARRMLAIESPEAAKSLAGVDTAEIAFKQIASQLKLQQLPDDVAKMRENSEILNGLIGAQSDDLYNTNKKAFSDALQANGLNNVDENTARVAVGTGLISQVNLQGFELVKTALENTTLGQTTAFGGLIGVQLQTLDNIFNKQFLLFREMFAKQSVQAIDQDIEGTKETINQLQEEQNNANENVRKNVAAIKQFSKVREAGDTGWQPFDLMQAHIVNEMNNVDRGSAMSQQMGGRGYLEQNRAGKQRGISDIWGDMIAAYQGDEFNPEIRNAIAQQFKYAVQESGIEGVPGGQQLVAKMKSFATSGKESEFRGVKMALSKKDKESLNENTWGTWVNSKERGLMAGRGRDMAARWFDDLVSSLDGGELKNNKQIEAMREKLRSLEIDKAVKLYETNSVMTGGGATPIGSLEKSDRERITVTREATDKLLSQLELLRQTDSKGLELVLRELVKGSVLRKQLGLHELNAIQSLQTSSNGADQLRRIVIASLAMRERGGGSQDVSGQVELLARTVAARSSAQRSLMTEGNNVTANEQSYFSQWGRLGKNVAVDGPEAKEAMMRGDIWQQFRGLKNKGGDQFGNAAASIAAAATAFRTAQGANNRGAKVADGARENMVRQFFYGMQGALDTPTNDMSPNSFFGRDRDAQGNVVKRGFGDLQPDRESYAWGGTRTLDFMEMQGDPNKTGADAPAHQKALLAGDAMYGVMQQIQATKGFDEMTAKQMAALAQQILIKVAQGGESNHKVISELAKTLPKVLIDAKMGSLELVAAIDASASGRGKKGGVDLATELYNDYITNLTKTGKDKEGAIGAKKEGKTLEDKVGDVVRESEAALEIGLKIAKMAGPKIGEAFKTALQESVGKTAEALKESISKNMASQTDWIANSEAMFGDTVSSDATEGDIDGVVKKAMAERKKAADKANEEFDAAKEEADIRERIAYLTKGTMGETLLILKKENEAYVIKRRTAEAVETQNKWLTALRAQQNAVNGIFQAKLIPQQEKLKKALHLFGEYQAMLAQKAIITNVKGLKEASFTPGFSENIFSDVETKLKAALGNFVLDTKTKRGAADPMAKVIQDVRVRQVAHIQSALDAIQRDEPKETGKIRDIMARHGDNMASVFADPNFAELPDKIRNTFRTAFSEFGEMNEAELKKLLEQGAFGLMEKKFTHMSDLFGKGAAQFGAVKAAYEAYLNVAMTRTNTPEDITKIRDAIDTFNSDKAKAMSNSLLNLSKLADKLSAAQIGTGVDKWIEDFIQMRQKLDGEGNKIRPKMGEEDETRIKGLLKEKAHAYNEELEASSVLYEKNMISSDRMRQAIEKANQAAIEAGEYGFSNFSDALRGGFLYSVQDFEKDLNQMASSFGRDFRSGVATAFSEAIKGTKDVKEAFADMMMSMADKILDKSIEMAVNSLFNAVMPKGYNKGGEVKGYSSGGTVIGGSGTKDDIPAYLSKGEYVVRRSAVQRYGEDFFNSLNQSNTVMANKGGNIDALMQAQTRERMKRQALQKAGMSAYSFKTQSKRKKEDWLGRETSEYEMDTKQGFRLNLNKPLTAERIEAIKSVAKDYPDVAKHIDRDIFKKSEVEIGRGGAKYKLMNKFIYDDAKRPEAGKFLKDSRLSVQALRDENNPENKYKFEKSGSFFDYQKERIDFYADQAEQLEAWKEARANRRRATLWGAATMLLSGGINTMAGMNKGGRAADNIPALLTGGEYVVRKDIVDKHGLSFFENLNRGSISTYNTGGYVREAQTPYSQQAPEYNLPATERTGATEGRGGFAASPTNNINIVVNIDSDGNVSSEDEEGDFLKNRGGVIGEKIKTAVVGVIIQEKKAGGLLYDE